MLTFADDRNIFCGAEAQSMFFLDAFGDNLMEARALAEVNYCWAKTSAEEKTWLRILQILNFEEKRSQC